MRRTSFFRMSPWISVVQRLPLTLAFVYCLSCWGLVNAGAKYPNDARFASDFAPSASGMSQYSADKSNSLNRSRRYDPYLGNSGNRHQANRVASDVRSHESLVQDSKIISVGELVMETNDDANELDTKEEQEIWWRDVAGEDDTNVNEKAKDGWNGRGKQSVSVSHPINFKFVKSHLLVPLTLHDTFTIHFQLKTSRPNGLLMYAGPAIVQSQTTTSIHSPSINSSVDHDFLAIELFEGALRYVFNVGGSGPQVIRSLPRPQRGSSTDVLVGIADNSWHDVNILHPSIAQHSLTVDGRVRHVEVHDSAYFHLADRLYIGGLPSHMWENLPRQIKSHAGFQGCLGSIDLNGDGGGSLLEKGRAIIPEEFADEIVDGCADTYTRQQGPAIECSSSTCLNGGFCIQDWNSFTCNCNMTSFSGPTCSDDGTTYTFGGGFSGGGLVTYQLDGRGSELTSTELTSHWLVFGLRTVQATDAFLVRVLHAGQRDSYIQFDLKGGSIFVTDRGAAGRENFLGPTTQKVNDGHYHVIRYTRTGFNSTLQIDDQNPLHQLYAGGVRALSSDRAIVTVGAMTMHGELFKAFHGSITGLVINGVNILEQLLAADIDFRIQGDVVLVTQPLRHQVSSLAPVTSIDRLTAVTTIKLAITRPQTSTVTGPVSMGGTTPSWDRRHPLIFNQSLQLSSNVYNRSTTMALRLTGNRFTTPRVRQDETAVGRKTPHRRRPFQSKRKNKKKVRS